MSKKGKGIALLLLLQLLVRDGDCSSQRLCATTPIRGAVIVFFVVDKNSVSFFLFFTSLSLFPFWLPFSSSILFVTGNENSFTVTIGFFTHPSDDFNVFVYPLLGKQTTANVTGRAETIRSAAAAAGGGWLQRRGVLPLRFAIDDAVRCGVSFRHQSGRRCAAALDPLHSQAAPFIHSHLLLCTTHFLYAQPTAAMQSRLLLCTAHCCYAQPIAVMYSPLLLCTAHCCYAQPIAVMYSPLLLCTAHCCYVQPIAVMHNPLLLCRAHCCYAQPIAVMHSPLLLCRAQCCYAQPISVMHSPLLLSTVRSCYA